MRVRRTEFFPVIIIHRQPRAPRQDHRDYDNDSRPQESTVWITIINGKCPEDVVQLSVRGFSEIITGILWKRTTRKTTGWSGTRPGIKAAPSLPVSRYFIHDRFAFTLSVSQIITFGFTMVALIMQKKTFFLRYGYGTSPIGPHFGNASGSRAIKKKEHEKKPTPPVN